MSGKKHLYSLGLSALSPIDGREIVFTAALRPYLSEGALHRHRAIIMIQCMLALSDARFPGFPEIADQERKTMDMITSENMFDSGIVAEYDHLGRNGIGPLEHDVKAVEFCLREKFDEYGIGHLKELIHFPMTSEDCSNLAQNLMIRGAINNVWLSKALALCDDLKKLSLTYAAIPAPGKTHGMNASPTTFGKRFAYFLEKCATVLHEMGQIQLSGKWGGAVGNNNAVVAVFPDFDIQTFACSFVTRFGFTYSPVENQRNAHLSIVRLLQEMNTLHTILMDLCEHIRMSVMMGWFVQKADPHHVGSSVMPHKVNPWRFEVAQGYLEQAQALTNSAVPGLIQSLFERDATDHPWERAYGEIFGKSLAAISYLTEDLSTIEIVKDKALQELKAMPEVLSETIQTAGRVLGVPDVYSRIKDATRGKHATLKDLHGIIDSYIPDKNIAKQLKALRPETYIGNAEAIAQQACRYYDRVRVHIEKGILHPLAGISAWVFDLDNTLHFGDKEELHARLSAISESLIMGFDKEDIKMFALPSDFQQMKKDMVMVYNDKNPGKKQLTEEDFQRANDAVTGTFDHHFHMPDRTVELLKLLRQRGIKTALVTTRGKQSATRVLATYAIAELFDVIMTRGDADNRKPHPEPVMKALKKLDVLPNRALFIGDKQIDDVGAGTVLGMQTALISAEEIDQYGPLPTYHFSSLQELMELFKSF